MLKVIYMQEPGMLGKKYQFSKRQEAMELA
jgi:hypothetical protein